MAVASTGSGEPTRRRRTSLPDPSSQGDAVGRDVLEARCALLETAVHNAQTVTAEQLAAARPGGKDNLDTSAHGWLYYFGALSRWHAQGPTQPTTNALRWDGAAMEDMRRALHAEPVRLTLESGRPIAVYPKGDYALHRLIVVAIARHYFLARRVALTALPEDEISAGTIELLALATEGEARLKAETVAILTHPGPGVPWTDDGLWEHPIPRWTRDECSPLDVLAIERAHLEVNLLRVNAIADRTKQFVEHGAEPMPMAAFLGVMASELGQQPSDLARHWSIGEVFASSLARFESTERAKAKAESKASHHRSGR
jgi:hypothetical protein